MATGAEIERARRMVQEHGAKHVCADWIQADGTCGCCSRPALPERVARDALVRMFAVDESVARRRRRFHVVAAALFVVMAMHGRLLYCVLDSLDGVIDNVINVDVLDDGRLVPLFPASGDF